MNAKVECPRCHKIWLAHEGVDSVDCNCHEYCEDGNKPNDCTLLALDNSSVPDYWRGLYNYPQGMHLNNTNNGDDVFARIKYCSTHSKFVTKVPIAIPVNWASWRSSNHTSKKMSWLKE